MRFLLLISMHLLSAGVAAQQNRPGGYRGIWFTLGQFSEYGDKYSGGLGTYTSSHVPVAVYSKPAHKTFFVYGGTTTADERKLLIMIGYFDHKKKQVPKPVVVYEKKDIDDPHDNASLAIDEYGYIWVFISGRGRSRPGFIFKSRSPYDIGSFDEVLKAEMTYPQPWWLDDRGFLYLFTKYTKGRELYWKTSSDGHNWTADKKLAGFGGHYQVSNADGSKIVTAFNYHPDGNVDQRTNIYLVQTEDMGKTWTNINGAPLELPLTEVNNAALVKNYAPEGKLVYLCDLNFDHSGNPAILAVISKDHKPGPGAGLREWVVIRRSENDWQYNSVGFSTHNYDMGSLYIDKHRWTIIGPTQPGPQPFGTGGEMALWESNDEGRSWRKAVDITSNSTRNQTYARRPTNAHPSFYAFWADGNTDSLSISELYFCNKKGNKVWKLPYTMNKDFQTPERIHFKKAQR